MSNHGEESKAQSEHTRMEMNELKRKTKLLKFTYQEVLDATKHQDDKIGRFLTAIAFLAATAFAMANIAQGEFLFRRFQYGNEKPIHLALYALTAFILGVIVTVLLLMSSFATPIRFPNMAPEDKGNEQEAKKSSTFYFNEIASVTLKDWKYRWKNTKNEEFALDNFGALINETHNLSLRAKTKYNRMTEAVSIFSLSLLAYAVSLLFVVLAASQKFSKDDFLIQQDRPIYLSPQIRLCLCLLLLSFMIVQLYITYCYENQEIDSAIPKKTWNRIFVWNSIAILVPIGTLCIFTEGSYHNWILTGVLVGCLLLHMYGSFELKSKNEGKKFLPSPIIIVVMGMIIFLHFEGNYYLQLFYSAVLITAVCASSGLRPAIKERENRRKFKFKQD